MFRLRQSTRRRFCRAIFLAACLLPLCALGAWGAYRHTALHVRHCEAALRQSCGLRASVAAVAHPRPGIIRLRELDLSDPETGRPLLHCDAVELRRSALRGSTDCLARGTTVRQDDFPAFYAMVGRLLRHEPDGANVDLIVALDEVTVLDAGGTCTLARVDGSIRADAERGEAQFDVLPAGAPAAPSADDDGAQRMVLRLARNRQEQPATTEIEFHTGDETVPTAWLSALAGELPALAGSRFQGSIWIRAGEDGGEVSLRGALLHLDLAEIVTRHFGFPAAGSVDLYIESAQVHGGKLVSATAQLVGGPGHFSPSLLTAAAGALGCAAPAFDPALQEPIAYERLALALSIDPAGRLALAGRCVEQPGAMLVGVDHRPLLMQPVNPPPSALALVQMLAGAAGPSVPATRQAALLLRWLPLPSGPTAQSVPATATRNLPPQSDPRERRLK